MEISVRSTGVDVSALTADVTKAFNRVQRDIGKQIAKTARSAVLGDVAKRRRGGLRFGTNRATGGRYRLGARTSIEPQGQSIVVTVTAVPAGFWSIVEFGSVEHEIRPRVKRALFFDELWSAHALHPGTAGIHVWDGAEAALDRAVGPVIAAAFDDAVEEAA